MMNLYPPNEDGDFTAPSDYMPLLRSLGEILVQVDDDDYSGDSRLLLRRGERYGVLIFGWGSCSGCDALQACEKYEDIKELRQKLESETKWGDVEETMDYLAGHDWDGDFSRGDETREYVGKAIAFLHPLRQRPS